MSDKVIQHYLVDIDTLFDLRLTLVDRLFSEVGTVMLHNREWFKRDTDKIIREKIGVSPKQFWGMYRENFVDLVKQSFATKLNNTIIKHVGEVLNYDHPGAPNKRIITINIPYGYMEDQDIEFLKEKFEYIWKGFFDEIRFSRYDYRKLTIKYMTAIGVTDYFCYNWSVWLKELYKDDKVHECLTPSFRVWFPTLKADVEEDMEEGITEEMKEKVLAGNNVFELVGYIHCPLFECHWLNTDEVSMFLPELQT